MRELISHPLVIPELNTEFLFRQRPVAVPGDLRPTWRMGLLVQLLYRCCRQHRSSLTRLHVLNWAVRTDGNRQALIELIAKGLSPHSLVVRFDPAFNRAMDFALAEGLVRRFDGSRIELTLHGVSLAQEISENEDVYGPEKAFIDDIRQRVTEALVDSIFGTR